MAYLAGVLAAFPASRDFILPYLIPVGVFLLGMFALQKPVRMKLVPALLLVLLTATGYLWPTWKETHHPQNHILNLLQSGQRADIEGVIAQSPLHYPNRIQFVVTLDSIQYGNSPVPCEGQARITLYQADSELQLGDRLRVRQVKLKKPRNFKNPGRFDFEHFMRARGIDVLGGVSKTNRIELLGHEKPGFLPSFFDRTRNFIFHQIDANLQDDSAALVKAMVLGEKQYLSDALRNAYIHTGLAHLMAVSGLHIGFVAGATYFLLYPFLFHVLLKFFPDLALRGLARKWTAALCLIPVLLYMGLVGAKVSALRAGLMIVIYLLALLVDREKNLFNALLVAGLLILVFNPHSLLMPGFLLSFTALLSIAFAIHYAYRFPFDPLDQMGDLPWYRRLPFIRHDPAVGLPWFWDLLAGTAMVSLPAILGTLPLTVYFFNQISLASLGLNLILIPLASLLVPFSLLIFSLGYLAEFMNPILFSLLEILTEAFVWLPLQTTRLPGISFSQPTPPDWWSVLYYTVLFGLPWTLYQKRFPKEETGFMTRTIIERRTLIFPAASLALLAWLIWPRLLQFPTPRLDIYLLDVGQGESLFLETPDHQTLLIDGGGYYRNSLDVGKQVVAPFLWNRGFRSIDFLAVSHSDQDHISGVESLVHIFKINHFLTRSPYLPDQRMENLRTHLLQNNTQMIPVTIHSPIKIGEVEILPLHPQRGFLDQYPPKKRIRNDQSWVFKITYKKFSFLFTGDITDKSEKFLVKNQSDLTATILKAPHHGSRFSNSEAFIDRVNPKEVIFSNGLNNPFRHPHPIITDRYRRRHVGIWRTDRDGAVHISTNGLDYQIQGHKNL